MVDPQIKGKARQKLSSTLRVTEERTTEAAERMEIQTVRLCDLVQKWAGNGNGKLRK
jgi:hypothetical protein